MDEAVVRAVLADWRTAPVSESLRSVLGLLVKLTQAPERLSAADMASVLDTGVSSEAITEVIYVCFLYSIIDRLADAFDFPVPSPQALKRIALARNIIGYRLL